MADEQFGELALVRRIDRIKALGDAAALLRAYSDKFIANELKQVAKRWGCRFLEFLEEALFVNSYAANKHLWLTDPLWPLKNDNNRGTFKDMPDKSKHALSQVTPQARHHYTLADQVNQLVTASEADPDMGFMTRLITLCSLPRTNPGNQLQYKRINGPYKLIMTATGDTRLPFGNLPRLILAWLCTEVVKTQSRDLVLGKSLSAFMRTLGMEPVGGGATGARTRLRNQMNRLFACSVTLIYANEHGIASIHAPVATRTELWWDPKRPDESSLWESRIRIGEELFNEIISHPVPLDMNILNALKRSSLGLDLYLWLTYRTFALQEQLRLSWRQVYRQFGADPSRSGDKFIVRNFRTKCLRELTKIKVSWPGLNYTTARGTLILSPSKPAITPAQRQLVK